MRILQVVRDMHPREGGPPRVVAGSAEALAQAGHRVTIAARVQPGEAAVVEAAWPQLAAAGVELRLFLASGPEALGGSKALASGLARDMLGFDVTHVHGVWDQVLVSAAKAARRVGRPYLVSPHGMLDQWSMARSRAKKLAALQLLGVRAMLDGADSIVFGTTDEAGEAEPLALRSKVAVIPNGVAPALLAPRDPAARARLHGELPQSREWKRIVLFYARLHPKKGLDLLIDAFAAVAAEFPGVALLAAGIPQDADYEQAVRRQAAATGLGERICVSTQFAGPDSRYLLDATDLFVLPSHQEGFSIAIVEALARALPALITDRCHLPEVEAVGAGRVVAAEAPALAAGLRAMLRLDDAALSAAGEAGRNMVAAHYTWPMVAERLLASYAKAAGR